MPRTKKVYSIKERGRHEHVYTGTVEELVRIFGYTLEIGASRNSKITRHPKTITSLLINLQKSFAEKEAACYTRTSVEIIPNP